MITISFSDIGEHLDPRHQLETVLEVCVVF
jgi:hypothetical protein